MLVIRVLESRRRVAPVYMSTCYVYSTLYHHDLKRCSRHPSPSVSRNASQKQYYQNTLDMILDFHGRRRRYIWSLLSPMGAPTVDIAEFLEGMMNVRRVAHLHNDDGGQPECSNNTNKREGEGRAS